MYDNKTEETVLDISSEITISRDSKPDYDFPFNDTDALEVVNEEGVKIPFREIYEHQKTIVVFIRVSVYIGNRVNINFWIEYFD